MPGPDHLPFAAVRSPEALKALAAWIGRLPRAYQDRGYHYYRDRRVRRVRAVSGFEVEALVEGGGDYGVRLMLGRGDWSSTCSCPMGADCKHVIAAGFAWVNGRGVDFHRDGDGATSVVRADELRVVRPARQSFREKWTPILAEKIGRPLSEEEERLLGQLSALFTESTQAFSGPDARAMQQHGFGRAIPPHAPAWGPVFAGWQDPARSPADPWELWQLIALSLEHQGCPIPEAFRPMTNTAPIRARADALLVQRELQAWRTALEATPAIPALRLTDLRHHDIGGLRAVFSPSGDLGLEFRLSENKPWKPLTQRAALAIAQVEHPSDTEGLPPAEAALAILVAPLGRRESNGYALRHALPPETVGKILASTPARGAVLSSCLQPVEIEPDPLTLEAIVSATAKDRLEVRLIQPGGSLAIGARLIAAKPDHLYWHDGRIWRGPPPIPRELLPFAAMSDPVLNTRLREFGLRLPASLELRRRLVKLNPLLRMWVEDNGTSCQLQAQLLARLEAPKLEQEWRGDGGWTGLVGLPPRGPDDPIWEMDFSAAAAVAAQLPGLRLIWNRSTSVWVCGIGAGFPDEFTAWRAKLPAGVEVELSPDLASLFRAPVRATVDFSATAQDAAHDWFDLTVALRVEDTTLTQEEIALLLRARGKWVRLPTGGWRRLEMESVGEGDSAIAALDRLGLAPADAWTIAGSSVHRLHALQLAAAFEAIEARDAALAAALRKRAAEIQATPAPELPPGLEATLRPYQREGFHFLAHLSANRFGGVLADDMGLGKTVQALAWLLHLAAAVRAGRRRFRALVVCPKSVTHGWLAETARFAPTLEALPFSPSLTEHSGENTAAHLLVANYTQLRLQAEWFQAGEWDAVILDEGHFIKNPASQTAVAARGLRATHRLALTGTPIENRLTDLWSLFAFVQPGLLGAKEAFRRQYDERDPDALARVHRRVRHFLLRRTKSQAAPDLPPRTEDDVLVDLEPGQRRLYEAELKRARQQLLGIESDRALDKVRFNVLSSLLRLRQICCHPVLVDAAHGKLDSAKLDALIERLEALRDEGHQVLVFSQFVEMLELIRERLVAADIGHLMLTGGTENRAELMAQFQRDPSKTVFLLSLKAAGFGLNLTAASYAVLYDPWWNPAVEAQAIDRTHRIGQTRPVIAYRLLARNTVEEKIRALQREKAALAAAVVKEESLTRVLDLESLRKILA